MTSPPSVPISQTIVWRIMLTIGIVHVLMGGALVVWPSATLTVVVLVVGAELLVSGALRIIAAAGNPQLDARLLRVLLGLVTIALGVLVMRQPLRSIAVVVTLLGVFWLLRGFVELFVSLTPSAQGVRGLLAAEGALATAGGLVLLVWPEPTVRVLALLAGVLLLLVGLVVTYRAWQLRDVPVAGVGDSPGSMTA